MTRTTYHHGNLREALAQAAIELARSAGPEAVTIRELARELEVSPAAIYRHFPDREALVAEVGRRSRGELATRMLDAVRRVRRRDVMSRAVDRFLAVGRAYLAFAREQPHLLAAAFLPVSAEHREPEDPNPWSVLARSLDDLLIAGVMLPERRAGAEVVAWSAVHGFATLRQSGAFRTSGDPEPSEDALLLAIARALELDVASPPRSAASR